MADGRFTGGKMMPRWKALLRKRGRGGPLLVRMVAQRDAAALRVGSSGSDESDGCGVVDVRDGTGGLAASVAGFLEDSGSLHLWLEGHSGSCVTDLISRGCGLSPAAAWGPQCALTCLLADDAVQQGPPNLSYTWLARFLGSQRQRQ